MILNGLLAHLCDDIDTQYRALGHQYGWRFLYTPEDSFHDDQQLFVIGFNPRGSDADNAFKSCSYKGGNAFLRENWFANKNDSGGYGLQIQIQCLYQRIADHSNPHIDYIKLMDRTLASNYVPFNSDTSGSLHARTQSLKFARQLWGDVLDHIMPRTSVCFGVETYRHFKRIFLKDKNFQLDPSYQSQTLPTGHGSAKYYYLDSLLSPNNEPVLLVGIPHPSNFPIYCKGRYPGSKYYKGADAVTKRIARVLEVSKI